MDVDEAHDDDDSVDQKDGGAQDGTDGQGSDDDGQYCHCHDCCGLVSYDHSGFSW